MRQDSDLIEYMSSCHMAFTVGRRLLIYDRSDFR
jgi:hypothetical protein